jgi:hypothetical protein
MPELAALQKELGSDQFEVVAVSVDRKGAEASSAFLKETGAGNLKLYVEPTTKIVGELQSAGLPATILIDRQGREVGRLLGPAHWAAPEAIALDELRRTCSLAATDSLSFRCETDNVNSI